MAAATRPLNPMRWLGFPVLACVIGSVLLATPVRAWGFQLPEPVFALVPAFAWAVIRPSVLPPFALLALGLFLDTLWGGARGLWPLCLLAAYAPVLMMRNNLAGRSYWVLWLTYAAACLSAFTAGFLFMSLDAGAAPSLIAIGWQLAVTVALFPFAYMLIERYEDADVRFR